MIFAWLSGYGLSFMLWVLFLRRSVLPMSWGDNPGSIILLYLLNRMGHA